MRSPLFLSLLLASSAVLAQNQGVMVLKSEQPYVSPFDKAPTNSRAPQAAALPAVQVETALQGEAIDMEVREVEKRETEKRAQAFVVNKVPQRPLVRKSEPKKKKDETRAIVKRDEPKAASKLVLATKDELKMDVSVIPSTSAQNTKAELTLPPPALSVKDNTLTSFNKELPKATIASNIPVASRAVVRSEETPTTIKTVNSVPEITNTIASETKSEDQFFAVWLLKALSFFVVGGVLMSSGWYWIKRQALYGDPAFQDPWFNPVKAR